MYFFDDIYSAQISESQLATYFPTTWGSYYDFDNYIFTNNADGTFGVYYSPSNFTGNTSDIQNFTPQITQQYCSSLQTMFNTYSANTMNLVISGFTSLPLAIQNNSSLDYYMLSNNFPSGHNPFEPCCESSQNCCVDEYFLDINSFLSQPLSGVTTIEGFEQLMTSELIDAKNRQTITAYPTLKAVYETYVGYNNLCTYQSSGVNYENMDQFSKLFGTYWVDLIEQVVPATTIWGSVKIYGNTIFDEQKFRYRKSSLFTCTEQISGITSDYVAINNNIDVEVITLSGNSTTYCNGVYIKQLNNGSEFIGSVNVISNTFSPFTNHNVISEPPTFGPNSIIHNSNTYTY